MHNARKAGSYYSFPMRCKFSYELLDFYQNLNIGSVLNKDIDAGLIKETIIYISIKLKNIINSSFYNDFHDNGSSMPNFFRKILPGFFGRNN